MASAMTSLCNPAIFLLLEKSFQILPNHNFSDEFIVQLCWALAWHLNSNYFFLASISTVIFFSFLSSWSVSNPRTSQLMLLRTFLLKLSSHQVSAELSLICVQESISECSSLPNRKNMSQTQ